MTPKPRTPKPSLPPTPSAAGAPLDGDTETRILNAARTVFVRRGTAGARMQEIAAEAGVNQALVHYYFGSKDELAERVFMDAATRLLPAMAALMNPTATLEQMVERFVHGYIDAVRATPFVPGYLLAEAHQHPERINKLMQKAVGTVPANVANIAITRLDGVIAERVAAGKMRPIPARQLLINVLAMVIMPFVARPVLLTALDMDDADFDEFLDERRRELPGFILNALKP
ncbi:MAG: helix-turn-helix domain-containing protein [Gemmatimonadaceae bacterium]